MKKLFLLIALVAFLGVTVAPVYAVSVDNKVVMVDKDDKPKKDKDEKSAKTEKKADAKSDTKAEAKSDKEGCASKPAEKEGCSSKAKTSSCGDKKDPEKK